ncbi:MAG: Mur ligase family protein [Bacillota bacterium]
MKLRLCAAILAGKIAAGLARLCGRRGSSLPGVVALRLYPGVLRALVKQVRLGVIVVTGTNGKTTTSNMIAEMLAAAGFRIVNNREGANLITGVTAAFVRAARLVGKITCDYAVLEVDEASFPRVVAQTEPELVVITNFFRDQLDRYGELDTTVSFIRRTLAERPHVSLVLNADDPLVSQLASCSLDVIFYGVAPRSGARGRVGGAREARFCPLCGYALEYTCYHYSQLGMYRCEACGFGRPRPHVEATAASVGGQVLRARLRWDDMVISVVLPTRGVYNLYNALAAFTAGIVLGIDPATATASLGSYTPATGRLQGFLYQGKPVYLNLVKNPAGFNETLNLLLAGRSTRDVFIAINDNDADGRDISWLWDVDFEVLAGADDILGFICSGKRGEEMAVRLKYAGVPPRKITVVESLRAAVDRTLNGPGEAAYFLATYTALWPVEKLLRRRVTRDTKYAHGLSSLS